MIRRALAALLALVLGGSTALAEDAARDWIARTAGQSGAWVKHGTLALPSGTLFVGDPTWGDDTHLRGARKAGVRKLTVWTFRLDAHRNGVIWLEAGGAAPVATAGAIDFGVDAAHVALGDLATGKALAALRHGTAPGVGDSHDLFMQAMGRENSLTGWVEVPPRKGRMFVAATARDGGLRAVWLKGARGGLSGILIDAAGRKGDGKYLDTLLPKTRP